MRMSELAVQWAGDSAWRREPERATMNVLLSLPNFIARRRCVRVGGPALPLAARRFQRAVRSGDSPPAQDGQVAVAVHSVRDELGAQRDGARRGRSSLRGDSAAAGSRRGTRNARVPPRPAT